MIALNDGCVLPAVSKNKTRHDNTFSKTDVNFLLNITEHLAQRERINATILKILIIEKA